MRAGMFAGLTGAYTISAVHQLTEDDVRTLNNVDPSEWPEHLIGRLRVYWPEYRPPAHAEQRTQDVAGDPATK